MEQSFTWVYMSIYNQTSYDYDKVELSYINLEVKIYEKQGEFFWETFSLITQRHKKENFILSVLLKVLIILLMFTKILVLFSIMVVLRF